MDNRYCIPIHHFYNIVAISLEPQAKIIDEDYTSSPSYLLRILARAASFAILIGSGIEPWSVKQLTIVDASFELIPQYR